MVRFVWNENSSTSPGCLKTKLWKVWISNIYCTLFYFYFQECIDTSSQTEFRYEIKNKRKAWISKYSWCPKSGNIWKLDIWVSSFQHQAGSIIFFYFLLLQAILKWLLHPSIHPTAFSDRYFLIDAITNVQRNFWL